MLPVRDLPVRESIRSLLRNLIPVSRREIRTSLRDLAAAVRQLEKFHRASPSLRQYDEWLRDCERELLVKSIWNS